MPIKGFHKQGISGEVYIKHTDSEVHPFAVVVHTPLSHGSKSSIQVCKTGLEAIRAYKHWCWLMFTPVSILIKALLQA